MAQTSRRPAAATPDMELAARAVAGDRAAFGELARRHVAAVRTQLRRMGAHAALADRLAQDAFLTSFGRMQELRGAGPFSGWIKRIAARLYIKHWLTVAQLADAETAVDHEAGVVDFAGGLASRLDLDAALARLSASERLCVSLCFGAGFSHADSAQALRAPVGAVKAMVRHGARRLRAAVDPRAHESPADFDRRLHELYAVAAPALDAPLFARRLEHRLDRVWAGRRVAISLAGAASALAAVWSVAGTTAAIQLEEAIRSPLVWTARRLGRWVGDTPVLRMLPVSGEVAWMLGGLVLLAAGLLATRAFDD